MTLRQLATAASTIIVACLLALSVPVSQLRLVATKTACCCPDPDHCKCPDHKGDPSGQPTMRQCHKTSQQFVSPVAPAFVTAEIEIGAVPEVAAREPVHALSLPHPAPTPRRPDAPS